MRSPLRMPVPANSQWSGRLTIQSPEPLNGDTVWALTLYASCGSAVAAASVWRALRARPVPDWALALWTGTAGLVGAELVAALVLGPVGPR